MDRVPARFPLERDPERDGDPASGAQGLHPARGIPTRAFASRCDRSRLAEVPSRRVSLDVAAVFVTLAWLVGVPSCARSPGPAATPPAEPRAVVSPAEPEPSPETVFMELEQRLGRTPWRVRFEVEAEGAVVASLVGSLSIADELQLEAKGSFAGGEHDVRLETEGDRLRAGPRGAPALDVPRPPELAAALVIGTTRMGLLHNVAMLVGGRPPDGADGGVREWVRTSEHERVHAAGAAGETGIAFAIEVEGQRVGRATVWIDARGLPVRREQLVEFPQGSMKVVERYEWLEPPLVEGPVAGWLGGGGGSGPNAVTCGESAASAPLTNASTCSIDTDQ